MRHTRIVLGGLAPLAAIAVLGLPAADARLLAQARPAADSVLLERLRAYAARYTEVMASVVADERYEQYATASRAAPVTRRLRSEVVMLRLPGNPEPIWFRDVHEVDGRRVRDQEQRLYRLLESNAVGTLAHLRRIAAESARYNLGRVPRTTNAPDVVFAYLTAGPGQISVEADRETEVGGVKVRVLRFREIGSPTVVRGTSARDSPARGRLWVEPESGALVRSEVILGDTESSGITTVDFVSHARAPVRVPGRMEERYRAPGEVVVGTATYTNLRIFGVVTSEQVRKPPGRR
ncbi:MAG: hypothetical protein R2708_03465 [Vicinamibacterales bacterium]